MQVNLYNGGAECLLAGGTVAQVAERMGVHEIALQGWLDEDGYLLIDSPSVLLALPTKDAYQAAGILGRR